MRCVVLAHVELASASITMLADPLSRFGCFVREAPNMIRLAATKREREDIACWRAIAKERKRLGLTPLSEEEMPIG